MTDSEEFLSYVADDHVPDKARILRARQLARSLADRSGASVGTARALNDAYLTLQFAVIAADWPRVAKHRRRCTALVRALDRMCEHREAS